MFSSEWDKYSQYTYRQNFGDTPTGDITKIESSNIPNHDVLVAGFPCQPFSISGVSKKNALGMPHGFNDLTQGTLFFEIKRIIKEKRPTAFLLENVKNLKSHDKGNTFNVILSSLVNDLEYDVTYKVINGNNYVPQNRERIYIIGFKKPTNFRFPIYTPSSKPSLKGILQKEVEKKYTLTEHLWTYLQNYAKKHKEKGNGFGFGLADLDSYSRTLSARYYKDGSEILIPQKGNIPRRLTPRECARLMGFPDKFKINVSDAQAYRQFGNSIVVPLIYDLAQAIKTALIEGCNYQNKANYKYVEGEYFESSLFKGLKHAI